MGSSEEGKTCKSDKSSSPAPDQTNIHVYPDWAAIQAYYGPRVAVPPFFNSAVASGHAAHPYIWGPPQHMMPPYGTPYAAIYPHGGVYSHPGVPIATTPISNESPAKSSGNSERGLMKKLKGFDGLAMSLGNTSADSGEARNDLGISQSGEADGSSEGSDGNTVGGGRSCGKGSREGTPKTGDVGKVEAKTIHGPTAETSGEPKKMLSVIVSPATVLDKVVGGGVSASSTTELELRNSPTSNTKAPPISIQQPACAMIPNELLLQNEREVKRERRKQSNRESARRSRLRKQAEAEELAIKVESLTAENLTLKTEINRLIENSEKLKLENAKLMFQEKSRTAQHETSDYPRSSQGLSLSTANLLSRVDNNSAVMRNEGEGETYKKNSNSSAKLRQLLDSNTRTDAVAAG